MPSFGKYFNEIVVSENILNRILKTNKQWIKWNDFIDSGHRVTFINIDISSADIIGFNACTVYTYIWHSIYKVHKIYGKRYGFMLSVIRTGGKTEWRK